LTGRRADVLLVGVAGSGEPLSAAEALRARKLQVGIVPTDLHRSLTFYQDVIGLEYVGAVHVAEATTLHNFSVGDGILKLMESSGAATPQPATEATDSVAGLRWVTMDVDDIDGAVARCTAAGAPFALPLTERRPGLRVAIVCDPDGNRVELVERT
jgi:catechol 2,3-dioxygenase-like lactoylglutathione lyase family enzyme